MQRRRKMGHKLGNDRAEELAHKYNYKYAQYT